MVRCHRVIDATSVYGALDPERDRNSMNYSGTRIARSSPPACNGRGASPERKGVQEILSTTVAFNIGIKNVRRVLPYETRDEIFLCDRR